MSRRYSCLCSQLSRCVIPVGSHLRGPLYAFFFCRPVGSVRPVPCDTRIFVDALPALLSYLVGNPYLPLKGCCPNSPSTCHRICGVSISYDHLNLSRIRIRIRIRRRRDPLPKSGREFFSCPCW